MLTADCVSIVRFQSGKDHSGDDCKTAQHQQSLVYAMDHLGRAGVEPVGNEKGRDQRCRGDAEADRHLLHGAGDGARSAGLRFRDVGIDESIHAGVLKRGEEAEAKDLQDD